MYYNSSRPTKYYNTLLLTLMTVDYNHSILLYVDGGLVLAKTNIIIEILINTETDIINNQYHI